MNNYLVFNTEAEAQTALDYINNAGWFPVVGRNAKTGELQPDKQQTTCWATEVLERVDGKWVFPAIPPERLTAVGVPDSDKNAFFTAFSATVEEYQNDWFPVEEQIV